MLTSESSYQDLTTITTLTDDTSSNSGTSTQQSTQLPSSMTTSLERQSVMENESTMTSATPTCTPRSVSTTGSSDNIPNMTSNNTSAVCNDVTKWQNLKCTILHENLFTDVSQQLISNALTTNSIITNNESTTAIPKYDKDPIASVNEERSDGEINNVFDRIMEEYATLSLHEQLSMGHQREDFIIDCQYAGASCYHEYVE